MMQAAKNKPPTREKRPSRWLVGIDGTPNDLINAGVIFARTAMQAAEQYATEINLEVLSRNDEAADAVTKVVVYPLRPEGIRAFFSQTMKWVMVPYDPTADTESG